MTRNELPLDKRKQYDELVDACMREIEEEVPEPQATFDLRPDLIRRSITNKYLPMLEKILRDAEKEMDIA